MRRQGKGESKQSEIRRKLAQSGIAKAQQFQEIISNLIGQRQRLQSDLRLLREKVVMLHEKQAERQRAGKGRRERAKPVAVNYRQQLQRKYDELKMWQKRSVKAMRNSAVDVQYRGYLDRLFSVEQEIQAELRRYADERVTWRRLRKAVRVLGREEERGAGLQDGVERENRLLKKRVGSLRKIVDRQLVKEIDLQNNLIDMREKERLVVERERAYRKEQSRLGGERERERHRTEVINPMTEWSESQQEEEEEIVNVDLIPGQVLSRDEVYQVEGRLNRMEGRWRDEMREVERRVKKNYPNQALNLLREGSKLSFGKELELILERCRANLNAFGQLNKHKVALLLERVESGGLDTERSADVDYNGSRIAKGLRRTQMQGSPFSTNKSNKRMAVTLSPEFGHQRSAQAGEGQPQFAQTQVSQYNDPFPLRRDFVGVLQQLRSDDRGVLGGVRTSSIKTLRVYYTDRGIASVQAVYNLNAEEERLVEGRLMLPAGFLESYCKVHEIDTNFQDFIRYFKLRWGREEGRITSIKIVSNRNLKNGFGEGRGKTEEVDWGGEAEKEYVLDIGRDEYPVSIFCSHVQRGPYWYLSGFGVEVGDL